MGYNMVHFTPIQPPGWQHGDATDATDATDLTTVTEGSAPGESGSCYALDDQARFRTSRTCLASFL